MDRGHSLRRAIGYPLLIGSLGLAGCQTPDRKTQSANPGDTERTFANCEANEYAEIRNWKSVPIDGSDSTAAIAAKAAADTGGISAPVFKSEYCGYELRSRDAGDRCFLFILEPPGVGGDIQLCVSSEGKVKNLFLGE